MDLDLNWTPQERAGDVNHSSHVLDVQVAAQDLPTILEEVQWRLGVFYNFNSGHNQVADAYTEWREDTRYVRFDMHGFAGFMSSVVNGTLVAVRLWCERERVYGDTAGSHMLIGQRRWSVTQTGPDTLRITTEAYERPRDWINKVGIWFTGRGAQCEVWRGYLQNIGDFLARDFGGKGTMTVSDVTRVLGNPWSPEDPYPWRGGDCGQRNNTP